jgi:hypothetical protein
MPLQVRVLPMWELPNLAGALASAPREPPVAYEEAQQAFEGSPASLALLQARKGRAAEQRATDSTMHRLLLRVWEAAVDAGLAPLVRSVDPGLPTGGTAGGSADRGGTPGGVQATSTGGSSGLGSWSGGQGSLSLGQHVRKAALSPEQLSTAVRLAYHMARLG